MRISVSIGDDLDLVRIEDETETRGGTTLRISGDPSDARAVTRYIVVERFEIPTIGVRNLLIEFLS